MKINKDIQFIFNKLNNNGFSAYLVGGCVRDFLMNKKPHDYDICTDAKPEEIIKIFKNNHLLLHGMKHGTVTIVLNKNCYEITTYRIDGEYKDNRRPEEVFFTNNLQLDLARRDFTINALAYNNKVVDYFNGFSDIENKTIRCVGNPEERFNEDALRILRALRFSSVLDFEIEEETKKAIFKLYYNLQNISFERINAEFSKLLLGKRCVQVLREFKEIFFFIIPELKKCDNFNQNNKYHIYDVWEHTLHVIENTPNDLILRLTALFHDVGKPDTYELGEDNQGHFYTHPIKSVEITEQVLVRLRYSNQIKDNVLQLIKEHSLTFDVSKKFLRKCFVRIGEENTKKLLIFRKADIIGQRGREEAKERLAKVDKILDLLNVVLEENNCFKITDLTISGKDLIALGIPQGKVIGEILNDIFTEVINGSLKNEKEILQQYIFDNYKEILKCPN